MSKAAASGSKRALPAARPLCITSGQIIRLGVLPDRMIPDGRTACKIGRSRYARWPQRGEKTQHSLPSGPSRLPAVYAAKADCICCAIPMMTRSMLVTTGLDEKGQTYLDREECETRGSRNRGANPESRIVDPVSPGSSSTQVGIKERRGNDCCHAHSLDPGSHGHSPAAGSVRGYRDRSARRLIRCRAAVEGAWRCARAHSEDAGMARRRYCRFCVIGSSLSRGWLANRTCPGTARGADGGALHI